MRLFVISFCFVIFTGALFPIAAWGQCDPDGVWLERQAYTSSNSLLLGQTGCVKGAVVISPLQVSNDTLRLINGSVIGYVLTWNGTIWVPAAPVSGADNWGTQVVQRDSSLQGNGTTGSPLGIKGYGAASNGQVPSKATGGITWVTPLTAEVDGDITNELQEFVNGSSATTHTVNLSDGGGTLTLQEGTGIEIATTGTVLDGIATITASDPSPTNELQTLANTSDATSHTVTLSSSGGSFRVIEGSNITLTTGGTGLDGTVTIAATGGGSNYQTLEDDDTPMTQQPIANFESTTDIAWTLVNDSGNTETEINADIPLGAVDLDEIENISTGVVLGNSTVSPGPPIELTPAGGLEISTINLQIADNGVTDTKLRQSAGLSVVGNPTNATANVQDITAASDGQVLRRSGTALAFGAVDLTSANAVTGILPVENGGTEATSFVNNRLLTGNGTSAIVDEANLTFDGTTLSLTGLYSQNPTGSYNATQSFLNQSGTITSTGNTATYSGIRSANTFANDGTVTGNAYYAGNFTATASGSTAATEMVGVTGSVSNSGANVADLFGLKYTLTENYNGGSLSDRAACDLTARFTGASDNHTGYGLRSTITTSSTGRWTAAYGALLQATNGVTTYGADILTTNNIGTGNTAYGLRVRNTVSGSGIIASNVYGISFVPSEASSGEITTYHALHSNTTPPATTNYWANFTVAGWIGAVNGSFRLGTSTTPARTFDNTGETRLGDLVTDTPTKIVGADADGDLDTVGIGAEAELHLTAGTLGTNFHTKIAPATLTAVTNNWNPTGLSTAWIIDVNGNGSFVMLTGITAPTFNKRLILNNTGDNAILLPTEMTTSTAGNRFAFGRDVILFPGKSIELLYSTGLSRWRLLSKAGLYDDVEHLYTAHSFNAPVSLTPADYDFWNIVSEAAATAVAPTSGRIRAVAVNTGSDAGGLGYVASKEAFFQTDGSTGTVTWAYCKAVIVTPSSLSDGTNDYTIRVGFNVGAGGGGTTDGMYFQYNHSLVSGNWGTATTNSGSTQLNNSGITVATTTKYVLEVVVRPNALVEYFIDGARVATNDTFVSTGDDMFCIAEIEKSLGTSQRDLTIHTLQTNTAIVK